MMNELGDQILAQIPGGILSRFSANGHIAVMAYNYPPEIKVSLPVSNSLEAADAIDSSGSARDVTLDMSHLPAGASFIIETLDRQHGNAAAAWEAKEKPEAPNKEQAELLRKKAWATEKQIARADPEGRPRGQSTY